MKDTIYVMNVICKLLKIKPIERILQGDVIKEEAQIREAGHRIKEYIISSKGRLLHWYYVYFIYSRTLEMINTITKAVL